MLFTDMRRSCALKRNNIPRQHLRKRQHEKKTSVEEEEDENEEAVEHVEQTDMASVIQSSPNESHPITDDLSSSRASTERDNLYPQQDFSLSDDVLSSMTRSFENKLTETEEEQPVTFKVLHDWSIDPDSLLAFYWKAAVTISIIYNCSVIILRMAFAEMRNKVVFTVLDLVCDAIYVLDIVFESKTTFLNDGCQVKDSQQTFRHYRANKHFLRDIISVCPVHLLVLLMTYVCDIFHVADQEMTTFWKYYEIYQSVLRLNRLLKCHAMDTFFQQTESRTNNPNLLRAFKLILHLGLVIHWIACLYYMMSEFEGLGINDWVYPLETNVTRFSRKYIVCMFWSTMTLTTIGERPSPVTELEYVFTGFTFLVGVFVFAAVVGNVGDVISNMNAARRDFQARMDQIKFYMNHRCVPEHIQNRIKRWAEYTWDRTKAIDEPNAMQFLPDRLRAEVAIHVHLNTLKKVSIFDNCEEGLLRELVLKLRPQIFSPGDYICRIGEIGREMYIINHGKVEILFPDVDTGDMIQIIVMHSGNFFGEISLLKVDDGHNKRTADVRSIGFSELLCLSRRDLLMALTEYPEAKKVLEEHARQRFNNTKRLTASDIDTSRNVFSRISNVSMHNKRTARQIFSQVMKQEGFTKLLSSVTKNAELTEIRAVLDDLKATKHSQEENLLYLQKRVQELERTVLDKNMEVQESRAHVSFLENIIKKLDPREITKQVSSDLHVSKDSNSETGVCWKEMNHKTTVTANRLDSPSKERTVTANMMYSPSKEKTVTANILDSPSKEKTVTAKMLDSSSKERTVKANILDCPSKEKTANMLDSPSKERTVTANIQDSPSKDRAITANMLDSPSKERTVNMLDSPSKETTVTANILDSPSKETTVTANILDSPSKETTVTANILDSPSKERTANMMDSPSKERTANMLDSPSKERTVTANKLDSPSKERTVTANKLDSPSKERTVPANLLDSPSKERTVTVNILDSPSKERTANILDSPSKERTANMLDSPSKVRAVTANILDSPSKEITANMLDSPSKERTVNILDSPSKERTVTANLLDSPSKERTVTANILDNPSKERTVTAKILDSPSKERTVTAKILDSPSKKMVVTANILDSPSKERTVNMLDSPSKERTVTVNILDSPSKERTVTAKMLDSPSKERTANILDSPSKERTVTANMLDSPSKERTANILDSPSKERTANMLDSPSKERTANILDSPSKERTANILDSPSKERTANLLDGPSKERTANILDSPSKEKTVNILDSPSKERTVTANMLDSPSKERTANMLDSPSKVRAVTANILDSPSKERTANILDSPSKERTVTANMLDSSSKERTANILDSPSKERTVTANMLDSPSKERTVTANILDSRSKETTVNILDSPSKEKTVNILDSPSKEKIVNILDSPSKEKTANMLDSPPKEKTANILDSPSKERTLTSNILDSPSKYRAITANMLSSPFVLNNQIIRKSHNSCARVTEKSSENLKKSLNNFSSFRQNSYQTTVHKHVSSADILGRPICTRSSINSLQYSNGIPGYFSNLENMTTGSEAYLTSPYPLPMYRSQRHSRMPYAIMAADHRLRTYTQHMAAVFHSGLSNRYYASGASVPTTGRTLRVPGNNIPRRYSTTAQNRLRNVRSLYRTKHLGSCTLRRDSHV